MLERLVGLPSITVLDVEQRPLRIRIETKFRQPVRCAGCGVTARVKDRAAVELTDLPCFGRQATLIWLKRRWCCVNDHCGVASWTETDGRIASSRLKLTDRAGRWATFQVGCYGRTVTEVAKDLGCAWHTVNDAVIAYGSKLVDDPDRIGAVTALGLDETKFVRRGKFKIKSWSTSIVDVHNGRLLDVVEGRNAAPVAAWLQHREPAWLGHIRFGTLDMSGPYRKVFDEQLPHVTQIADPFHVCRLANQKLDEVRRRVQQDVLGRRGHKHDPLFKARKLLVLAAERLDDRADSKLRGLLAAGDPHGEVATAWHAKEATRSLYDHCDPDIALTWVDELSANMRDRGCPPEIRQLGRTLRRWRTQIAAWHKRQVTNGPTETMNAFQKRIKRIAFGMTNFTHWRIRVLLYCGKPDWSKLATITP